jgi:hypothetical protein
MQVGFLRGKPLNGDKVRKKEVIYKIKSILDNLDNVCTNQLRAEVILAELDRVGMLPPSVPKVVKHHKNLELIENVHEWENE